MHNRKRDRYIRETKTNSKRCMRDSEGGESTRFMIRRQTKESDRAAHDRDM